MSGLSVFGKHRKRRHSKTCHSTSNATSDHVSAVKAAQAVVAIGTDARMQVKSEAVPVVMLMLVMIATMLMSMRNLRADEYCKIRGQ